MAMANFEYLRAVHELGPMLHNDIFITLQEHGISDNVYSRIFTMIIKLILNLDLFYTFVYSPLESSVVERKSRLVLQKHACLAKPIVSSQQYI